MSNQGALDLAATRSSAARENAVENAIFRECNVHHNQILSLLEAHSRLVKKSPGRKDLTSRTLKTFGNRQPWPSWKPNKSLMEAGEPSSRLTGLKESYGRPCAAIGQLLALALSSTMKM